MTGSLLSERAAPAAADRPTTRRRDIEGLRAVAVLLVVAFHAGLPLPGGFIGVDVFFVISGFVIMSMLLPQLERDGTIGLAQFYGRRIRRLLPALALLLLATVVASVLLLSPLGPQQATASTGAAASEFTANFELYHAGGGGYFDLPVETNALLHTWSLSVEEQFYLFLPAFLIVGWKLTGRWRARWSGRAVMAALLGAAASASFLLSMWTSLGHGISRPTEFAFYSSPTRAWEFAGGAVLALLVPVVRRAPLAAATAMGLAGATLIGLGAVTMSGTTTFPGAAALVPVAGAALLLAAGTGSTTGLSLVLSLRPLVWLGGLSYSWYLWHWPVIVFARTLWPASTTVTILAAAVSIVPAWLAWRVVETPLRFDERLAGRRIVALAAVCILVPFVVSVGVRAAANRQRDTPTYRALDAALVEHADVVRGCDQSVPLGRRTRGECTWTIPGSTGTVYLVGDSNAGQFTEGVQAAAARNGEDLTVATYSACPFVDLDVSGGAVRPDCHPFVRDTVQELVARRPALVVMASDSSSWVADPAVRITDPATGAPATTEAARTTAWREGVERVLRPLADAGVPTLVVHTVPQFLTAPVAECPAVRVARDQSACGATMSRGEVDAQQRPTRDAVQAAVDAVPTAHGLDVTDLLCATVSCSMGVDDAWRYRDGGHITVGESGRLTDTFAAALAAATRSAR